MRCRRFCGRRSCPGSRRGGVQGWAPAASAARRGGGCGCPGGGWGGFGGVEGGRLVSGKDFSEAGELRHDGAQIVRLDEAGARGLAERLDGVTLEVRSVEEKPYTARPQAPFMTSTLQQEAGRKLRF